MNQPLVTVLIVTWNRKADLLEALKSIQAQSYRNVEVVVVDNNSTDGTREALQQDYPTVKLVALEKNLGAAGGRNAGIAVAQGEIVFLLDSDAALGQDTLTQVVQKFQHEPEVGILYCKVVNAYTNTFDHIAGWIFTEKDKIDQDREFLSYGFSSAGSAVRRNVFERAGLFWDLLFIYREEDELSLRVWDAGYKILYFPSAVVYHRASPTQRTDRGRQLYFDLRNSLYIYLARYPWWMFAIFFPLKIILSWVKGIRKQHLSYVRQALVEVVGNLPAILRQRQPIRDQTARLYLKIQRQHGPLAWDLRSWLAHKT